MTWKEIPGDALTDLPVVAASTDDHVFIFLTGTDRQIYVNRLDQDDAWTGWETIPGDARTTLPVAATRNPYDDVTVVHVGEDGYLYHATLQLREGWTAWSRYDDEGATAIATALVTQQHRMHAFHVGKDQRIYIQTVGLTAAE
ncbi:MAG: hypothetical protein WBA97_28140 [Actinophytocola sp.]|uniref:hypothetical protein n=1 Tax=Actinophytocola sp. TaxID=1872138 RepID=UPI003C784927